jgi:hypothetical protein
MRTIRLNNREYDLHAPVRGAEIIGEIRGTCAREAYHAAEAGKFQFRKDGKSLVSTPFEILLPLLGEEGIQRLLVRTA